MLWGEQRTLWWGSAAHAGRRKPPELCLSSPGATSSKEPDGMVKREWREELILDNLPEHLMGVELRQTRLKLNPRDLSLPQKPGFSPSYTEDASD